MTADAWLQLAEDGNVVKVLQFVKALPPCLPTQGSKVVGALPVCSVRMVHGPQVPIC